MTSSNSKKDEERGSGRTDPHSFDRVLVRRCLMGDETAWGIMVRAYASPIFAMSYRYTHRADEAEDLTQEIFIRIFQNLQSFHVETGNFRSWAMRLSRNLIIDRYRSARRSLHHARNWEAEVMHLEDRCKPGQQKKLERDEAARFLRGALCTLPPETKRAIVLRDVHGLGYQEMAEILGIPEGTVKSRINRGRLALARYVSRHTAGSERHPHAVGR